MERLAAYFFEWVLPGHGQKVHLPAAKMRDQILRLAESMREKSHVGRTSPGPASKYARRPP